MTTFAALGLKPELAAAVAGLGFTQPTPIQEQAIPALLENPRDLVGLARTGTGKTAAFGLPLLHYIDPSNKSPQALVLCPTRELCMQITEDLKNFAKQLKGVYVLAVYGGSSISMQIKELRRGIQVVVGTPGRLNDLIERGALKLGGVQTVVLDEADEMLNMGFREAIDTILAETPSEKNTWLFSATMPDGVARIARSYMSDPVTVSVKGTQEGEGKIEHFYSVVHARDRYAALRRIIDAHPDIYGIVFCRTKMETQEVADHLIRDGYVADALHGDLSQAQRDHVMKRFRRRTLQMLVATDVAARGIDVDDVTHVLHYQLPDEPESYTHRSGRTGRAGKSGISIALLHGKEMGRLRDIERTAGRKLIYLPVPAGVDVIKNRLLAFAARVRNTEATNVIAPEYMELFRDAMGELTSEEMLEKFMTMSLHKLFEDYNNAPDLNVAGKTGKDQREERKHEEIEGERHTFFISIGRMDGVDPGALLRVLCDQLNTSRRHIGRIDLKHNFTFFQTIALDPAQVLSAFKGLVFRGRPVRVNQAENEAGGGGKGERGWKSEANFEKSYGEKKSYGSKDSFGEKRSYGEKKSYGEKRSYGAKKEYGDKKSYGDRKSYGDKKSYGDSPGKGFGAKKSKSAEYGESNGHGRAKEEADDWKKLMSEPVTDRKKKFKKK